MGKWFAHSLANEDEIYVDVIDMDCSIGLPLHVKYFPYHSVTRMAFDDCGFDWSICMNGTGWSRTLPSWIRMSIIHVMGLGWDIGLASTIDPHFWLVNCIFVILCCVACSWDRPTLVRIFIEKWVIKAEWRMVTTLNRGIININARDRRVMLLALGK